MFNMVIIINSRGL